MDSAAPVLPDYSAMTSDELNDHLCQICSHIYAAEYQLMLCIREWVSAAVLRTVAVGEPNSPQANGPKRFRGIAPSLRDWRFPQCWRLQGLNIYAETS